jgi:hypothetical protein
MQQVENSHPATAKKSRGGNLHLATVKKIRAGNTSFNRK